jgi:hypothetical protein
MLRSLFSFLGIDLIKNQAAERPVPLAPMIRLIDDAF